MNRFFSPVRKALATTGVLAVVLFMAPNAQAAPTIEHVNTIEDFTVNPALVAHGDYLYGWDSSAERIVVVNMSDLTNESIENIVSTNGVDHSDPMIFEGTDEYLFLGDSDTVEVYSLADPSLPAYVGSDFRGGRGGGQGFSDIAVDGNVVYVASTDGYIEVLEIDADQSTVTQIADLYIDGIFPWAVHLSEDNQTLFVQDEVSIFSSNSTVVTVDVSDSTQPQITSNQELDGYYLSPGVSNGTVQYVRGVDPAGMRNWIFEAQLYAWDTSDVTNIQESVVDSGSIYHGFFVMVSMMNSMKQVGNYLYVNDFGGITIFGLADPLHPDTQLTIEPITDGYLTIAFAVTDDAIFVLERSESPSALQVYQITDADEDADGVATADDCDDRDASASEMVDVAADRDNDGYHDASTVTQVCENAVPSGFILVSTSLGEDVDDTDPDRRDTQVSVTVDNVRAAGNGYVVLEMSDDTEQNVRLFRKFSKTTKTKVKYHSKRNQYMVYHPKWKKVVALNGTTGQELDRMKLSKKKYKKGRGKIVKVGKKRVLVVQLRKKGKSRAVFIRMKSADADDVFSKKRAQTLTDTKLKRKRTPRVKKIKKGVFRMTLKDTSGQKVQFTIKKPKKKFSVKHIN